MELESFAWLLTQTADGQALLDEATRLHGEGTDPIRAGELLRRRASPDRAALVMGQADLRVRATVKFGADAARLYFTPDGLEQATRAEVARHRAARISFASPASVVDLGCGIGGDLLAVAATGTTTAGVDLDPLRVAVARANLDALGLAGAVLAADATTLDLAGFGVVVADPARRTGAGRVFDVDAYTPPWSWVESLLHRPAVVKVAPGIPHERVPHGVEAEWVSFRGEVKEAALWSPQLALTPRRATVLGATGLATVTVDDCPPEVPAGPVAAYLYEPDGAVIRAGLVGAVVAAVRGHLLDPRIAYVASDAAVATPFARGYRVLEEVPFHEKPLKAALRERGIGRLTIKKRGVDVVPERLRPRLALRGPEEATLVLTRVAERGTALLVQPLTSP